MEKIEKWTPASMSYAVLLKYGYVVRTVWKNSRPAYDKLFSLILLIQYTLLGESAEWKNFLPAYEISHVDKRAVERTLTTQKEIGRLVRVQAGGELCGNEAHRRNNAARVSQRD